MKILTFTTLYPNREQPRHGIFVETRLRKLLDANPDMECIVVAPVPWFPFAALLSSRYAGYSKIPKEERRHKITVHHPRYLFIPKIGMSLAPLLIFLRILPFLKKIKKQYDFELIDAHYYYPDGVSAVMLGQVLARPVLVTARGSDINLFPEFFLPRKMLVWAIQKTEVVITVSGALKDKVEQLGADPTRVKLCRNGVDIRTFSPVDNCEELRQELKISGKILLMVGNLVSLKGHDLVINALTEFSGMSLIIIGTGPEEKGLKQLVRERGLQKKVSFLKNMTQQELVHYYSLADALILASSREGMPNVVLESLACGTPVVATDVGGVSEIINCPAAGIVVQERSKDGIAAGVRQLFSAYPESAAVREHIKSFSWNESVEKLTGIFRSVVSL